MHHSNGSGPLLLRDAPEHGIRRKERNDMLKALTPACAGTVVVLLWLTGGGPAGPGADVELAAAGRSAAQAEQFVPVTDAMLRNPAPADWLMAYRT